MIAILFMLFFTSLLLHHSYITSPAIKTFLYNFGLEFFYATWINFCSCLNKNPPLDPRLYYDELCNGLGVVALFDIICVGSVPRGVYYNPIITFAALLKGKISCKKFFILTLANYAGSYFGYLTLIVLNDNNSVRIRNSVNVDLCGVYPPNNISKGYEIFRQEFFPSFILVLFYTVLIDRRTQRVKLYMSLLFCILAIGTVYLVSKSDVCINPVRAFWTSNGQYKWIFFFTPYLGSLIAVILKTLIADL